MKIGVIGAGMMGGTLGALWAAAGHDVFFGSRHPEALGELLAKTPRARAGSAEDAARFGDVIFLGVPYAAMPGLAPTLAPLCQGKLVLDAGNVIPKRDGELATEIAASKAGSGTYTQSLLPGARVVKAFNTVHFRHLESEAHRDGPRIGVPLAGDDAAALEEAAALVRDAGQEPLILPGGMAASAKIDFGQPVWNSRMRAAELRGALGLD